MPRTRVPPPIGGGGGGSDQLSGSTAIVKAARKVPVEGSVYQMEGDIIYDLDPEGYPGHSGRKKVTNKDDLVKSLDQRVFFNDGKMFVVTKWNEVTLQFEDGTLLEDGDSEYSISVDDSGMDPGFAVEEIAGLPDGWSGLQESEVTDDDPNYTERIYSDFQKPEGWQTDLCSQPVNCTYDTYPGEDDTNTVYHGELLGVPEDKTDTDYLILSTLVMEATGNDKRLTGALARGSAPFAVDNLRGVTGTAIYEGPAFGIHTVKVSGGEGAVGNFRATVRLTADFGSGSEFGSVRGEVSGFDVKGPTTGMGQLKGMTVELQQAIAEKGGLVFRGLTVGSRGNKAFDGRWGVQFFGNGKEGGQPGSAAGTFGIANGDIDNDAYEAAVGAFGAHRQP